MNADRENRERLYASLIAKYGADRQLDKAIEEFGELLQVLSKVRHGEDTLDHLAEELWDSLSGLEQIAYVFDLFQEIEKWKHFKINRTADRLERGK